MELKEEKKEEKKEERQRIFLSELFEDELDMIAFRLDPHERWKKLAIELGYTDSTVIGNIDFEGRKKGVSPTRDLLKLWRGRESPTIYNLRTLLEQSDCRDVIKAVPVLENPKIRYSPGHVCMVMSSDNPQDEDKLKIVLSTEQQLEDLRKLRRKATREESERELAEQEGKHKRELVRYKEKRAQQKEKIARLEAQLKTATKTGKKNLRSMILGTVIGTGAGVIIGASAASLIRGAGANVVIKCIGIYLSSVILLFEVNEEGKEALKKAVESGKIKQLIEEVLSGTNIKVGFSEMTEALYQTVMKQAIENEDTTTIRSLRRDPKFNKMAETRTDVRGEAKEPAKKRIWISELNESEISALTEFNQRKEMWKELLVHFNIGPGDSFETVGEGRFAQGLLEYWKKKNVTIYNFRVALEKTGNHDIVEKLDVLKNSVPSEHDK